MRHSPREGGRVQRGEQAPEAKEGFGLGRVLDDGNGGQARYPCPHLAQGVCPSYPAGRTGAGRRLERGPEASGAYPAAACGSSWSRHSLA